MTRGVGPRRRWTPAEDELLEQLAGDVGITRIARRLNRTVSSVSSRAGLLGISMRPIGVYSLNQLWPLLGMWGYRQLKGWLDEGLIVGAPNPERGPSSGFNKGHYEVREEEVVRFLKANPHLIDRARVDPLFRQHVSERWITLGEAFKRGAAHIEHLEHAYRAGLLPEARKRGQWVVIPEVTLPYLVEARRRLTSDLDHRRQWMQYAQQQRRGLGRRRSAYHRALLFDHEPIVRRLEEVGRLRAARSA